MKCNKTYVPMNKVIGFFYLNDIEIPNPFSGFDVFEGTEAEPRFGLDAAELFQLFVTNYQTLKVFEPLPAIGTAEIVNTVELTTIENEDDQYAYIWHQVCMKCYAYLTATYEEWDRKTKAYCAQYKPLENYNMVEHSGASSLTSDVKSYSGTHERKTYVYPFDSNSGNGSPESREQNIQGSNDAAGSGFTEANKSLTFDDITTPQGNATQVGKLTRSGNIGVTTSQQMLESELTLRDRGFINEFLKEVAKRTLLSEWQ